MQDETVKTTVSRRDFLKGGALLGAAAAGASVFVACSPSTDGGGDTDDGTQAATTGNPPYPYDQGFDYEELSGYSDVAAAGTYDFEHLNQPYTLKGLEIRNRIFKSCASGAEGEHGNDVIIEFYRELAKGGVGLISKDTADFTGSGMGWAPLSKPEDIAEGNMHTKLIEACHENGAKVFLQFGATNNIGMVIPGMVLNVKGSSTVAELGADQSMNAIAPTPMTTEEVEQVVANFVNGIALAKEVGYDGVEINAGSTHLLADFISRHYNTGRDDKYSDSTIENLGRIVTEIIEGARAKVGDDYIIGVLINGHEMNVYNVVGDNERCNSIELQCELAKLFEDAGSDYFHVRSAAFGAHMLDIMPDCAFIHDTPDTGYGQALQLDRFWPEFDQQYRGAGAFIETAAKIKAVLKPETMLYTTGLMNPLLIPDVLDKAVGESKIDAIGITRQLYADPYTPNKVLGGDLSGVRPCANCLSCWHDYCRVNAAHARIANPDFPIYTSYEPAPATTPKKVLVAGAGPAGLEFAHVAAERGHTVTVWEKGSMVGGRMLSAISIKGKNEKMQAHINWLQGRCDAAGVTVEFGKEATADTVAEFAPNVFVAANGSVAGTLNCAGADSAIVGADGDTIVVIGANIEGMETAIYYIKQGKNVVALLEEEADSEIGNGIPAEYQPKYIAWCETHGIRLLPNLKLDSISDSGITFTHDYGVQETIECNSIKVCLQRQPDASLLDSVAVAEKYAIGTAKETATMVTNPMLGTESKSYVLVREAIRDGNQLAREI